MTLEDLAKQLDKEFIKIEKRFTSMDERFTSMDERFTVIEKSLNTVITNQFKAEQKYDEKIAALFDAFDTVQRKLDSVDANYNTLPHRQALSDIRFEEISLKLSLIESECKQHGKSIENLRDAFAKWIMPYELRLGAVERRFTSETMV